ncbi:MAG: hypothetical protein SH819_03625 [Cytophagales bacterium]|nr:hypothetical protein [Cytophagales bacterium]
MKKAVFVIAVFLVGSSGLVGCFYDRELDQDPGGIPANVSFSNDVVPVLNKNCAGSGCHDAIPTYKPSLVADQAYSALNAGGYISQTVPSTGKLYQSIAEGNMPPGQPMSTKDVNLIIGWLEGGAKNN